jgi:hypothetical protein
MKILCIADIHGDNRAVKKVKEFAKENNFQNILILGDFPAHGKLGDMEDAKVVLNSLLEEFNLLVIPGNCDSEDLISLLEELNINLHKKIKVLEEKGVKIFGFGGSNITPFNTPLEFEEEENYGRLKEMLSPHHEVNGNKFILATHCPPKDTKCDIVSEGIHVGSLAIRKIIEEYQPFFVVSSHVHESGGTLDEIGKTKVANIGKLSDGNVGIIEIRNTNGKRVNLELKKIMV